MDRLQRDVILIRLIEALAVRESWCGETHVQKTTYFLQEMVHGKTGFDFILYKHGPFSFDLSDELTAMRADGLVTLQVKDPRYGPSILPEPRAKTLMQRFQRTLKEYEPLVRFVADKLGDKPVVELERLATAHYVRTNLGPETTLEACAGRIHELKPHISVADALAALQTVETWTKEAEELRKGLDARRPE
jgi:uncharacterized protein YwgA